LFLIIIHKTEFVYLPNQTLHFTMSQKVLLTAKEVTIILHRLACQLIEKHLDFSDTILVGIQPRGVFLAERLKEILEKEYQTPAIT
jgi:pyrimidine operon attenuation protein/uracil phosphoribosyltransferase